MIDERRSRKQVDKSEIRRLERALTQEGTRQRSFVVRFNDESIRIIKPSQDDPTILDVQIYGRDTETLFRTTSSGAHHPVETFDDLKEINVLKMPTAPD